MSTNGIGKKGDGLSAGPFFISAKESDSQNGLRLRGGSKNAVSFLIAAQLLNHRAMRQERLNGP